MCGEQDWYVMTIDCDYFWYIEYNETCYINYAHDPCDLANNTCFMPHYDVNGTWQYNNCTEFMQSYEGWSMAREVLMWRDSSIDTQLPYVHEYWDQYHDIYDPDWWTNDDVSEYAIYSDYDWFMEECQDQECEWVDCDEDEQLWESGDCWKELCYGCDMTVCQLWHWDNDVEDWDTEECLQDYDVEAMEMDSQASEVEMAWEAAGAFEESAEMA